MSLCPLDILLRSLVKDLWKQQAEGERLGPQQLDQMTDMIAEAMQGKRPEGGQDSHGRGPEGQSQEHMEGLETALQGDLSSSVLCIRVGTGRGEPVFTRLECILSAGEMGLY